MSSSSTDPSELSSVAKAFLYLTGFSVLTCSLVFTWIIYSCVSAITRRVKDSAAKAAKSKAKAATIKAENVHQSQVQHAAAADAANRGPGLKTLIKDSQKAAVKKGAVKDDQASHHVLFLNTLKGHADVVNSVAWSADGSMLATACEDMQVRIFHLDTDMTNREPKTRRVKTNKLPVGAGFADANTIMVVERGIPDGIAAAYGPTGVNGNYEQQWQVGNLHGRAEPPLMMRAVPAGACIGGMAFMVSLSTKKDVRVYTAQGHELAVLEPNSLGNHDLAVSLDGRFIAVASFTSEVKIWEMRFAKDMAAFKGAGKAMELKGHKSQVMCTAFSPDNRRAITASKDGTLRVWNIDVRYTFAEDPKTLLVIPMALPAGKCYQRLALGPTGIIAASHDGTVHMLSSLTGDLLESIDAHEGTITAMQWCPKLAKVPSTAAPVAVLATSSRDKRVRLWRSP